VRGIRILISCLLLFQSFFAGAQILDSIRSSIGHKPRISVRLDTRNSFISTRSARILGFKAGLEFNKIFRLGVGYNWLGTQLQKEVRLYDQNYALTGVTMANLRLRYISFYAEYVFYRTKRLELCMPVQIGLGTSSFQHFDGGLKEVTQRSFCMIYELNVSGHYKVIPWVGIGGGIGYRFMPIGNNNFDQNFNSPIFILKIKLFFADFYRDMKNRCASPENQ